MFGIAAAEIFSDLVVRCRPEAFQVVGDLHRAIVGTENVQQDRDAAAGDPGCLGPAEEILEAHGEDRRPAGFIRQLRFLRGGQNDGLGRAFVQLAEQRRCQPALEERNEIDPLDLVEPRFSLADGFEKLGEHLVVEIRPVELGDDAANEFHASEPNFGGRILQKEVGRLFPKRVGEVRAAKVLRCSLRDVFPKEEIVIPELVGCEDAASWLVVASRLFATNVIGKEFLEPFQLDGACQIDSCLEYAWPAKVACVECHEQVCVADDGFGGEADAAASDHHSSSLQAAAFDHPIGVGEQNPLEQCRRRRFRRAVARSSGCDLGTIRSSRSRATWRAANGSMPRLRRVGAKWALSASASKSSRVRMSDPRWIQVALTAGTRVFVRPGEPDVFFGKESGDRGTVAGAAALSRRDDQARQPGMHG